MESIHGPGATPQTMPSVRPARAPDPETLGQVANDAALPYAPADIGSGNTERSAEPESAPAGVDPELWGILTAEEREFFSVAREMGPVTYGRQTEAANDTSLPRGRRLDVRV